MEERRVTIDSSGLRSRMRTHSSYTPRPSPAPHARLISDFGNNISKPLAPAVVPSKFINNIAPPVPPSPKIEKSYHSNLVHQHRPEPAQEPIRVIHAVPQPIAPQQPKRSPRINSMPRLAVRLAGVSLAVAMIAVGGYMSVGSWRTDKIVKTEANALTNQANQTEVTNQVSASSSDGGVSDGTSNSGNTTLSDIKPTAAALANYVVAANLPRYLIIPKLNVDARVLSVGVNTNGDLGTPNDIYDTAWYNESAQPGQPGATLIDGHIAGYTSPGVFEKLKSLNPGDQIEVQIGNGTTFTYQVVKSQDYPANNVNMAEAMTPVTPGVSGLNLISCDGTIVPGKGQYTERIIVFAELVQ